MPSWSRLKRLTNVKLKQFTTMKCQGSVLCVYKIMRHDESTVDIAHLVAFIACLMNPILWLSIKRRGKRQLHLMFSFNFIFWRFGSVCLLNEVRCNLVIFGNNSHHRDQYGHITMEGTRRSFSKLPWYTQELVLMGGQHECKRQIQFTAAILKSNCLLAINVHPIRPCLLLFSNFFFKWTVGFEMQGK